MLSLFGVVSVAVVIEENIGLSGSETVGVIIAIISGATVLIILVLLASMGCRYIYIATVIVGMSPTQGDSMLRMGSCCHGADTPWVQVRTVRG